MSIKAIGFDVGGTLIDYNKPLNWRGAFKDALTYMCKENNFLITQERIEQGINILQKYNTRINPRQEEVSSNKIFGEILGCWEENNEKIFETKKAFYTFFQREVTVYPDAKKILQYCKEKGIKTGIYTDVAYGMDDEFSLKDINEISEYIDLKLTSRNVGYRKPHPKGFELMLERFECQPKEMIYVGDEEKDIVGAKSIGIHAILINRTKENKEFGQENTISTLEDLFQIIPDVGI